VNEEIRFSNKATATSQRKQEKSARRYVCGRPRRAQQEKIEMAKDQKAADQPGGIAEQAMEQARRAADIYFDYVKQAISATPSGGNEFAESLKECAEKNITATQEFLKQLSQARNFQDVVRVQSDYMKFLTNAFGEQSLAEAYTKTAADAVKKSLTGMS
jgi:phosphosulfolactate synthase (CoM biosynthesis protein A)